MDQRQSLDLRGVQRTKIYGVGMGALVEKGVRRALEARPSLLFCMSISFHHLHTVGNRLL